MREKVKLERGRIQIQKGPTRWESDGKGPVSEMTSFGIIWLAAIFGPIAVGLVVFGVAVRAGYRIWPIWLIGLPLITVVFGWPEGSWLGIPWAGVISGEAGQGGDAGGLGLGILFLFFWTVTEWVAWSFAALFGSIFKPN
jgi:hypothetical protein